MTGGRPELAAATRSTLGFGMSRLQRRDGKRRLGGRWTVQKPRWVDPYPWVMGTFPEKLVFAWLADRGIPFTFQATFPDYPGTLTVEEFRPDFRLDQFKVIIEVQGEYWHSLPAQAEQDVYKFSIYKLSGWTVYWFWESDILADLASLMLGVDELRGYVGHEAWTWEQRKDDLAALRTMNAKSRRPTAPRLTRR